MSERRILESWKAIAAYLGHSEKTCRKWEHELGLPVHRLEDSAKAHVFAYADELDQWRGEKLAGEKRRKGGGLFGFAWFSRLSSRTRIWIGGGFVLLLVALAGFLVWRITSGTAGPGGPGAVKSIAVLPFVDLSPNKEYDYLCDGMVETLIASLNKVEGLRVPGRTSSFYFKGKDTPPREIGKKLKVDYVLEASVQADGERLRVIPRLLSVADGYQLWSEKFDRGRQDIFAVEDDIARRVVENLKVRIAGGSSSLLVRPDTTILEAHNLYLQGRYLWTKRGHPNMLRAIGYFEKAIGLDPQYARGYAGLSLAYYILGNNLYSAPGEAFPKAKDNAIKAIELDDSLAEAHYALGSINLDYDWDFAGAERELKRAMQLDPRDGYSHQAYAFLLMDQGKHDEAIKEIRLARDLDPLALRIRANIGLILYFARRYAEAEKVLKEEIQLEPGNCAAYDYLTYVYREMSLFDLAVEFSRKTVQCYYGGRHPTSPHLAAHEAQAYARMGKPEEARRILDTIENSGAYEGFGSRVYVAIVYGWLGDRDRAFGLLEKAYADRDTRLPQINSDPALDCLREDPRFKDLVRRIGLEK